SWARGVLTKILLPARPAAEEQQQSSAWHSLDASLRDLRERRVYQGHESGIWAVDFHPGSDLFVTGSEDFSARIWGIQNPDYWIPLRGHSGRIWRVRFTKDGKYVGTASEDKTARIWETVGGALVGSLEGHTGWVTGIDFSPVDELIATSSEDRTVRLWTKAGPGAGWRHETLARQGRTFRSVLFTADGA